VRPWSTSKPRGRKVLKLFFFIELYVSVVFDACMECVCSLKTSAHDIIFNI
jgi:hypothetical protein